MPRKVPTSAERDHCAQDRGRLADRAHRVDYPEHRRDDAERRQRPGQPLDRRRRRVRLVVMGFDLVKRAAQRRCGRTEVLEGMSVPPARA